MSRKEELAEKVGMQFDEVVELFSEETLNSMQLGYSIGGDVKAKNCAGGNCTVDGICWCVNIHTQNCSTPTPTPTPMPES
jgi:hypothetical protein